MAGSLKVNLDRSRNKALPLYEQIRRSLAAMVRDAKLLPGSQLPTISALSQEWSVHPNTIRSALKLLSQDGLITYEAHKGAVVAGAPSTFAVQYVRWRADQFSAWRAEGIRRFLGEVGQQAVILDAGEDEDVYLHSIRTPQAGVGGMVLFPSLEVPGFHEAVDEALAAGVKIITIGSRLCDRTVSSVAMDGFAMGYLSTHHLIARHGRPVYTISARSDSDTDPDPVRDGWITAMHGHGFFEVEPYDLRIDAGTWLRECTDAAGGYALGREKGRDICRSAADETCCIMAVNGFVAHGVYEAAQEAGRQVGRDVFIVAAGDLPLCERLTPTLTSTTHARDEMGYLAARMLYEEMNGAAQAPRHVVLPVELKVRGSSVAQGE